MRRCQMQLSITLQKVGHIPATQVYVLLQVFVHDTNCSGLHGASSRECPVWLREKEVQRVKAENISFPQARQIVTQQQSTLLRSGPTSAAVVSAAVSVQRHPTVTAAAPIKSSSVAVQTDLTWPSGDACTDSTQVHILTDSLTKPPNGRGLNSLSPATACCYGYSSAAKMIRLGRDRPHVVLLPVLLSKNHRKLSLTKQTKRIGRSSEDPQGRTQSSLQTTDITL